MLVWPPLAQGTGMERYKFPELAHTARPSKTGFLTQYVHSLPVRKLPADSGDSVRLSTKAGSIWAPEAQSLMYF